MPANDGFFDRRRPPAAFKHGILSRYPRVFASKLGSKGRVVFLDGYAGAGRYEDGSPASPVLFARTALSSQQRNVRAIFVEQDAGRCASLRAVLAEVDPDDAVPWVVREGDLGVVLPELLPRASGAALLAFLDPFGTALDLPQLRGSLLRRPGRAATEVLLHFSLSTIARLGGILRAAQRRDGLSVKDRKTIKRGDDFLGGDWWHEEFAALGNVSPDAEEFDENTLLTATDVAMRVADRFCGALAAQTGFRTVAMPVRPAPGRAPQYVLVLFTKHDDGVWNFASTLGYAGRDWMAAVHDEKVRKQAERFVSRHDEQPEEVLFSLDEIAPLPPPPFDPVAYERDNRNRWVDAIATNINRLLIARGELRLVDHVDDVYGDVLGQAWERHVRAAVYQLHRGKLILDDGTKDFWKRTIRLQVVPVPEQRLPPSADRTSAAGAPRSQNDSAAS